MIGGGGGTKDAKQERITPIFCSKQSVTWLRLADSCAGKRLPALFFRRVSCRRMLVHFQLIMSFPATLAKRPSVVLTRTYVNKSKKSDDSVGLRTF